MFLFGNGVFLFGIGHDLFEVKFVTEFKRNCHTFLSCVVGRNRWQGKWCEGGKAIEQRYSDRVIWERGRGNAMRGCFAWVLQMAMDVRQSS